MVRTRSAAAALVDAGHARVNGQRVTAPGHALRPGDVVTLALDYSVRVIRVEGFAERRGDSEAAKGLYKAVSKSGFKSGFKS
jgi:ribosome-associated heat shock protein Hsp15